jgi:hypothetical protein
MNTSYHIFTCGYVTRKDITSGNQSVKYIEDIQFFSINTGFIFIKWYENTYFMSGDSHE